MGAAEGVRYATTTMAQATSSHPAQHISREASAEIVRALRAYQAAHSLDDYDLADIVGVSRDTIGRWRREPVALKTSTVQRLLSGLEEHMQTASAMRVELVRLLTVAEQSLTATKDAPAEQLRRRLNERGLRGTAVIAVIDELGFRIEAKDDI